MTGNAPGGPLAAMPEDKRQRIIDVCIEEFRTHGYQGASTNAITERAQISKGLLFHYFGSKRNLYLYLIDYVMDYFFVRFSAEAPGAPTDIWERMAWWSLEKLRMYELNPLYYAFFSKVFFDIPKGLEKDMASRYQRLSDYGFGVFMKDLDTSGFRPGVDRAKALEVIVMTLDGLSRKYLEKLKVGYDFDRLISLRDEFQRDINEYLDLIRFGVCDREKR